MTDSAPERPVLTRQQTLALNYIKLTWDRFYDVTCDGTRWSAIPKGWGEEYALNCDGTVWTAIPATDPWLVLSEPTAARLRAAMYLDAAARRIRSGATAARWAHFSGPGSAATASPVPGR